MKLLIASRHFGYLRNFESVIIELARRGHQLRVVADRPEQVGGQQMVERIAAQFAHVSIGWTPVRADQSLSDLMTDVRLAQDHLRYMDPVYDDAPKLRERSEARAPWWLVRAAGRRGKGGRTRRALLARTLAFIEDATPAPQEYIEFLEREAPDVVVLTPLVDLGSPQLDMLKAARQLGLRTVLAVGSWDHLSSKALIRIRPDMVTVWNRMQLDEAVSMHGIPVERVSVTGAQCYDQWFDRAPSRAREEFCRSLGLPSDRALLLYVCSSPFRGEPPEVDFVITWLEALRSRNSVIRHASVLIRPHPGRAREWEDRALERFAPIAVHGANPIDQQSRDDYFDALFYSAAVIGLNTSAFIEAGVVGRPVHALLAPEFRRSQQGTLHFRYLTQAGGGLLRLAHTFDEHVTQLEESLRGERLKDHNRAFVEAFVRPFGLDQPATPRLADVFEAVGSCPRHEPWSAPLAARMLRPLIARVARRRHPRAAKRRTRHQPLNSPW